MQSPMLMLNGYVGDCFAKTARKDRRRGVGDCADKVRPADEVRPSRPLRGLAMTDGGGIGDCSFALAGAHDHRPRAQVQGTPFRRTSYYCRRRVMAASTCACLSGFLR
jgi:hypothetical protein